MTKKHIPWIIFGVLLALILTDAFGVLLSAWESASAIRK